MATRRKRPSGTWEFTIRCKSVRKEPFYFTFDDEQEGIVYIERLEALLRQGIVPRDLADKGRSHETIREIITDYLAKCHASPIDIDILNVTRERIGSVKLVLVNYAWVETWITGMKHERNLAPSTIRHHVGALARCFDWASKIGTPELIINPLRLLPRGYASYNDSDKRTVETLGKKAKIDESRVRRFEDGEELKIRKALVTRDQEMLVVFELAIESAMRMREIYTLGVSQLDFDATTIFLDKTKNGDPRQVPMTTIVVRVLKNHIKNNNLTAEDNLFKFWDGSLSKSALKNTSSGLSQKFAKVFEEAKCGDLHFHDLRHEATSRIFERSDLSDAEIMKITGHKGIRMLLRYANLRGSKLAPRLW